MRAHTQIPCICINKIHVQACACIYIWSKRESLQIRSVSERVANCMDKLFTFYLPALSMKYAI